jgi:hypothetical protein
MTDRLINFKPVPQNSAVAGWLLWFCISFTFFAPLSEYRLMTTHKLPLYLLLIYLIIAASSFMAGLTTWAKLTSSFVFLRIFLGVRLAYGVFQAVLAVSWIQHANRSQSSIESELEFAVANIFAAILIYLYFRTSLRVRQTLGKNI